MSAKNFLMVLVTWLSFLLAGMPMDVCAQDEAQIKSERLLKRSKGKRGVAANIFAKSGMLFKKRFNPEADYYIVCNAFGSQNEEWQNILSKTEELANDNIQIVMVYSSNDEMKEQRKTVKKMIKSIPELKNYPIVFTYPASVLYNKGRATPAFSDMWSNRYKAIKFDGSQLGGGTGMNHYFGEVLDKINKDKAANPAK